MEFTSLCIRRLVMSSLLLVGYAHFSFSQERDFPEIVPTKLQIFEYKPISFDCEGFRDHSKLTVMREVKGKVSKCVSTWKTMTQSACALNPAYQIDSGRYWCESNAGEISNTVNINITAGSVILESPVRPVMEGDSVSLRCRSKMTSSGQVADFYKDGVSIRSGSTGEISIRGVFKSHEGLYWCSISDFGESPPSWLAVRASTVVPREPGPPSDPSCHIYLVLRTVFTIFMVALLLLLVSLLHFGKLRVTQKLVCVCRVCKGSCQTKPNKDVTDKEQ